MERLVNSPPPTPPLGVAQPGSIASELSGGKDARKNFVEQEETSILVESGVEELLPMKWTDEKHSLYLKSMEASFVSQLHDSLDLLGWQPQENASSQSKPCNRKPSSEHYCSGQFKVFRDGYCGKVNFQRGESQLNNANESVPLASNPWIQRYRSGSRQYTRAPPSFRGKDFLVNMMNGFGVHFCHQDSVGSNTGSSDLSHEVTDQNFTNEDPEEEKNRGKHRTKRMKTTAVANHDQIVPLGESSLA